MNRAPLVALGLLVVLAGSTSRASHAQSAREVGGGGRGDGLFLAVYHLDGAGWRSFFGATDRMALPITFGAGPAIAVGRLVEGDGLHGDAWRASLSVLTGFAISGVVKRIVRRERPFRTIPGVEPRIRFVGARHIDRWSFPSGHATMAAALAVSIALDHPEWYIVAPAALWAGAVGSSRVWLGVHYPGDVLAGWVVGGVVAWAVHELRNTLTPSGWDADVASIPITLRLGF